MRTRNIVAVGAILVVTAMLYLRFHIHELAEIALTYSTFYPLLHRHPDILYRYPANATSLQSTTTTTTTTTITNSSLAVPLSSLSSLSLASSPVVVPKIINQIALGNATISKYSAAIKSCTDLHPGWKHQIWSDQNATDFMAEYYPEILPHYVNYPQNIQRANILRYALLHHAGGIYVDLDVTCRVALDDTPLVRLPFVSPGAHPAGVNNAFIAAQPGHPFLAQLLGNVPSHDLKWGLPMRIPYVENMLSTGCMFFSNQWMSYVRSLLAGKQDQSVYILADENGEMAPHMLRGKVTTPIFIHGGASSWHGWDAALFLTIGDHYLIYLTGIVGTICLLVTCLHLTGASRRRTRHKRCFPFGGMSSRTSGSPTRRERKPSIIGDAMA